MKNIPTESYGLQPLTKTEMVETHGGTNWLIQLITNPVAAAAAAVVYIGDKCVNDWSCFKDGLAGNDFKHK